MNMYQKTRKKNISQTGFTLIELLVVIGILAILLAITLIAINPNKHFQDARNTQRRSDVSAVLDAIYEYESANNGTAPPAVQNVTSTAASISKGSTASSPTGTSFLSPSLTFTGLTGNTITSGMVTVTGCSQTADNGTYQVTSGTATTIVVTNTNASSTSATGCSIRTGVNLCTDLAPTYIADVPKDATTGTVTGGSTPCTGTSYDTGYTISLSSGRYTVNAPGATADGGATVSVTR